MKTRQTQMMLTRAALYRCINSSDLYTLQRLTHEGHEFEDSVGYLGKPVSNSKIRVGEITQQIKEPAANSANLSLIPGTHMVKEPTPASYPPTSVCALWYTAT